MPELKITYDIAYPGEPAAGLIPFTETITVIVESGDPGSFHGEFESFFLRAIEEWYDGAHVTIRGEE
jgi:hypothetical protein